MTLQTSVIRVGTTVDQDKTAATNRETAATIRRLRVFADDALTCGNCIGSEKWYGRRYRWILANRGRLTADQATAAFAICSTNATVAENEKNFLRFVGGGPSAVRHFGSVIARLAAVENGRITDALAYKHGRKIVSFYDNCRRPYRSDKVTIDRHAMRILVRSRCGHCAKNALARKGGYARAQFAYRVVARLFGMRPLELQARTWVHLVHCHEGSFGLCAEHATAA